MSQILTGQVLANVMPCLVVPHQGTSTRSVGRILILAGICVSEVQVAREFAMSRSSVEYCNKEVAAFGSSLSRVSGGLVGLAAAGGRSVLGVPSGSHSLFYTCSCR